ncbi:MAG TPA: glycosyltransferase [Gemmatimonadales bacterium]|nr:glycosyltransferase [Gemmatimonadales bacterium]
MRNVLLVARNFAPTSHVSVERAIKLAKYLPEFGWRPTVLTGDPPTAGLPSDPQLLEQVRGIDILKARAPEFSLFYRRPDAGRAKGRSGLRSAPQRGPWHPKAWLVPDSQLLWYPFAVRASLGAAPAARWDAVVATSFPPTALLIGRTVAARLGIPYVADFRDSWTGYHHAPRRPAALARYERWLETRVVADAAAVVAVDHRMVAAPLSRLPASRRPPFHLIPNGYDEEDFAAARPRELPRFSIVHAGQLRRAPRTLWAALTRLLHRRPELGGRVHLWQIGFVDVAATAELEAPPDGVVVHVVPPVPQQEAIGYMMGADLLLVEEFRGVMPSKTLQYLRAGRPILGLLDGGAALREVLGAVPHAHLVELADVAGIEVVLERLATASRGGPALPSPGVAAYSRREIARRFAELLDAACTHRSRRPVADLDDASLLPSGWRAARTSP